MRPIPGYPGYQAGEDGQIWSDRSGKFIKGGRTSKYGHMHLCLRRDGKPVYLNTHTAVLLAFVGPCPPGHEGLHNNGIASDNRLENLRWGTPKENGEDMSRHGHCPRADKRGEKNSMHKLTAMQIVEIRNAYAQGATQKDLGEKYGVHGRYIGLIVRRVTWKHVGGDLPKIVGRNRAARGSRNARSVLVESQVVEMRARYANGEKTASLAEHFGISFSTVRLIVLRLLWKHVT